VNTNTPIAAFALLNDPVYVEAAQALARRITEFQDTSTEARAKYAFRRVLARPPSQDEANRLLKLYEQASAYYGEHREAAVAMATSELGDAKSNDMTDLAAWTVVGNALLNLDETLTK
jgi:hypothetical protein